MKGVLLDVALPIILTVLTIFYTCSSSLTTTTTPAIAEDLARLAYLEHSLLISLLPETSLDSSTPTTLRAIHARIALAKQSVGDEKLKIALDDLGEALERDVVGAETVRTESQRNVKAKIRTQVELIKQQIDELVAFPRIENDVVVVLRGVPTSDETSWDQGNKPVTKLEEAAPSKGGGMDEIEEDDKDDDDDDAD